MTTKKAPNGRSKPQRKASSIRKKVRVTSNVLTRHEKEIVLRALKIAHHQWRKSQAARGGCQPDNESELNSILDGRRADAASNLYKKLGGTRERMIMNRVHGSLD